MRRILFGVLAAALPCMAAQAQSLTGALEWLPPGSLSMENLKQHPEERLEGGPAAHEKTGQSFYVELGRLAFRSPDVLGGTARKAGLSCQACHANGFATVAFFIPGLSDRPGRIDVSHAFWNLRGEDGVDNPVEIPTLRGVKTKDRLGHDRRSTSLREFTRRVIVTEFAGAEPDALLLDALVAYQEKLQPAPVTMAPVSLQQDLADLVRYLDALRVPLAEEQAALSARIATMIRGQIGFIHERFAPGESGDDMRESRATLESWSRQLAAIADQAEGGEWPQARAALADLRRAVAAPPSVLAADLPRSLYDPERLRVWLSKPVR
jgi:cytochrome c553